MSDIDAILASYTQQLDAVREDLLFPLLPKWAVIEAKVTIAILAVTVILLTISCFLNWKKGSLWVLLWEPGGYCRLNVLLFLPVNIIIFDILYIVALIGNIIRNVPNAEEDWIPYYPVYQLMYTIPLFFMGAFWTWNSILTARQARKTMLIQTREVVQNLEGAGGRIAGWNQHRKAFLIQIAILLVLSSTIITITCYCVITAIHRENAIRDFRFLYQTLQAAQNEGKIPSDFGKILKVQSHLESESEKTYFNYKRISGFEAILTLFLTIPYAISIITLAIVLKAQKRHFKGAIQRLYQLEEMDHKTAGTYPSKSAELARSPKGKTSGSVGGSASSGSQTTTSETGTATSSDRTEFSNGIVLDYKLKKEMRGRAFTSIANVTLAKQQKDIVERMKRWKRTYKNIVVLNSIALLIYSSYTFTNVINFVYTAGNTSINQGLLNFASTHLPTYFFVAPCFFSSFYLIYDAYRKRGPDPRLQRRGSVSSLHSIQLQRQSLAARGGGTMTIDEEEEDEDESIGIVRNSISRSQDDHSLRDTIEEDNKIQKTMSRLEGVKRFSEDNKEGDKPKEIRFIWSDKERPSTWARKEVERKEKDELDDDDDHIV